MDIDKKDYSRHAAIVAGVRTGQEQAMLDLYTIVQFHRYALFASVGQESEDKLHDIYIAVVESIRRDKLADPERLIGFVHVVCRRTIADSIKAAIRRRATELAQDITEYGDWLVQDNNYNPHAIAIDNQWREIMQQSLDQLEREDAERIRKQGRRGEDPKRNRQLLEAFYLQEVAWRDIARELEFNDSQFRCHKSRALARFGRIGREAVGTKAAKVVCIDTRRPAPEGDDLPAAA